MVIINPYQDGMCWPEHLAHHYTTRLVAGVSPFYTEIGAEPLTWYHKAGSGESQALNLGILSS
jgi:hypothetical protein